MRHLANIFWLGTKELRSLARDLVLLVFLVHSFTFAIYSQATGLTQELRNASIAIIDEDRSVLSRRIAGAFLAPFFKTPELITLAELDDRMDRGRNIFVLDIPPNFQADVTALRRPAVQLNVDATAVMQAGIGAGYIQEIISQEIAAFLEAPVPDPPVALRLRMAFNPNLTTSWFTGVMALLNNVTLLTVLLAGAAVIREREHGTLEHLLVMPVSPFDIAMAKIWANGLVIALATFLSLRLVIGGALGVPITGSVALFMVGTVLYLFFATSVGILLGTVARSMPQLGLLFMLIVLPMNLLSGGNTPFESMPQAFRIVMSAVPSAHFVGLAQAILYRDAGLAIVWPRFLAIGALGALVLGAALLRFRSMAARGQS